MYEFGTYRLTYEPPQGALESTIDMSISAEADLEQATEFFTSFLRAAGYPIDYSEVLEVTGLEEEKVAKPRDGWGDDWGDDNFVFTKDTVIQGASGTDTLSLGDARAAVHFESGAKNWEDVISFG